MQKMITDILELLTWFLFYFSVHLCLNEGGLSRARIFPHTCENTLRLSQQEKT